MQKARQATVEPDSIREHLCIIDKTDSLIRYRPNRLQRHLFAHLTGRDLVLKYRQGGVSTGFVAENLVKAITQRARIGVMAHDNETTQKLRRMAQVLWENLPPHLQPERGLDNARTTSYRATGSEITIATAGSANIGVGGTYPGGFHGSEVSRWKDAPRIMSGIMQGVPLHAPIALESAANGAQGWYYERCMEALRNPDGGIWTLHFYPWWWGDDYRIPLEPGEALDYTGDEQLLVRQHGLTPEQIKFRRYKQLELGDLFWQEYPEDPESCFLTSGRGVFVVSPDLFYSDFPTEPEDEHRYVMGVDWGQNPDATAASVWDSTDYREVALLRTGKRDYDVMIEDVAKLAARWQVSNVVPEKNSMGVVAGKYLANRINELMPDNPPNVRLFNMTNRRKDDLVKLFQQGLKDGARLTDNPVARHELRIFQTRQTATGMWTYSHPDGEHDDTVIARLLAHRACF